MAGIEFLATVVKGYFEEFKSISTIAKELNTYPNDIRRLLMKNGYSLRDKSAAQSISLKTGAHPHPTKGKKRTEATKLKISEGLSANWDALSEEEKASRSQVSRDNWNAKSPLDRETFRKAASKAILKAAKDGSKIEHLIMANLVERGYHPLFHHEMMLPNERLQIDIFIPELATAIEIDGPTHYKPIWGEDKLQKQVAADNEKNGLLLSGGFNMIRVKYTVSKITLKYKKELEEALAQALDKLANKQKTGNKKPEIVFIGA